MYSNRQWLSVNECMQLDYLEVILIHLTLFFCLFYFNAFAKTITVRYLTNRIQYVTKNKKKPKVSAGGGGAGERNRTFVPIAT